MASNNSFDVTTGVDYMEVSNAVTQATKEITQRYNLKGLKVGVDLDQKGAHHHPGRPGRIQARGDLGRAAEQAGAPAGAAQEPEAGRGHPGGG